MTRKTQVVWDNATYTAQLDQVISDEVVILMNQGKTDGVNQKIENSPIVGQNTNIRTWNNLQTAEEWIIFINSLGIPPVSTAILPEETPE